MPFSQKSRGLRKDPELRNKSSGKYLVTILCQSVVVLAGGYSSGSGFCSRETCCSHSSSGSSSSCFLPQQGFCREGGFQNDRSAKRWPWSHKPVSLNGRLGNSEIGGCKEIREPFANPSPTPRQPFANPLPTLCQPFLPTPLQPPLSVGPRHPFRDTG